MSRRIFLSATTSPVSLFLALYTTPYVPSPIFSTFWKFSMKRLQVGAAGPGGGLGTLQKARRVLGGGGGGNRARHRGPRSGWNAVLTPSSCQFVQLETMLPPPPAVPYHHQRPRLSFPRFPDSAPSPFYWPTSGRERRTPRPSQQLLRPRASLVLRSLKSKTSFCLNGEAEHLFPNT